MHMRIKHALTAFCIALLLPTISFAKKPEPVPEIDAGCAVLPYDSAYTGETLKVKVRRIPSYPGGWFSPTVTGTAVFPMPKRSAYEQTVTQTIDRFSVNAVDLEFNVPALDTGIITVMSNGSSNSKQLKIDVTVREPLSGGSVIRETSCSASLDILPGM
jgi:hypothetical protein